MQNRFFEIFRLTAYSLGLVYVCSFFYSVIFLAFVNNSVLGDRIPEDQLVPLYEEYWEGKMDFSTMLAEYEKIVTPIKEQFQKEMTENPSLLLSQFYDKVFSEKPHYLLGHSIPWFLCYVGLGYLLYKKVLQIPVTNLQDELSIPILLRGIANGFLCFIVVVLFGLLLEKMSVPVESGVFAKKLYDAIHGNAYLLAWGIYVVGIITGILEEIFFRGFLLKAFIDKNLAQEGLFIVSLLFGWLHYGEGTSIAIPFIICGVGMFFGYIYIKTGNIWIAMACHATYNSLGLINAYLQLPGVQS